MKKIIASASLAALGATGLQAAYAPGLSPMEKSKPWTISALVRGFYDDNPTDSPRTQKQDTWGLELSPSLAVNLALDQTLIGFNYVYDLRFYEARPKNDADHMHQFTLKVDHAINERYKVGLNNSFNYAQEPELTSVAATTLRTQQPYLHNNARLAFNAELTPIIGLEAAYQNNFWDFDQRGPGSLSALLDRVEHLGSVVARWQAMPATVGLLGYRYEIVDHTSSDSTAQNDPVLSPITDPARRDTTSHYVYVGADQSFNPQLTAHVEVGAQFTDYPNRLTVDPDSTVSPYIDANATWTYNPGSYVRFGVVHKRNATDVAFQPVSTAPTLDQESTGVYGTLNHRITPKVTGSVIGQFQHSTFKGGLDDGKVELLGTLG
ncbi:MAG: hypothetical protein DME19_09985, partial [Verrucomicrobia bacterium]